MSDIGIALTVTGGFVVQLCTIAFLYCMAMEKRQIEHHQREIEDLRHEAIEDLRHEEIVVRLDAIFAKLLEQDRDRPLAD